ncbi:MAG TPA: glutamine-hydrolyzing carbamoyl-phosphate synthase small subunit [Burkholderiaceae bacterium]|nr:glutamine-hydrolyzing carbamoyl-phosphate synthase small subunit [Burkholderiaceae bacterium]
MPSLIEHSRPAAVLALADGTVFRGVSIGAPGSAVGEVVFNTALTGYQEILTDPSYARQIVTLTYPHIGNVGTNSQDDESERVFASALVVRDVAPRASNFRSQVDLPTFLKERSVVAIAGIDTRSLTRRLRDGGAQAGAVMEGDDAQAAVALARTFPGMSGLDLASVVSASNPYVWDQTEWRLEQGYGRQALPRHHVVAFDFGIKRNILRMLAQRGCRITVVPARTSAPEVLRMQPDGVFLSNGPGDPEPCGYAISATRELIERGLPTFGICLGHQIMGLASGARTIKMKFGHHGANHPVQDLDSGRVLITSQNHGFAVDPATLPSNCQITHVSLFDGSLQGFRRKDRPAFCFQGHPEASPGPKDIGYLFDRFLDLIEEGARSRTRVAVG